MNTAAAWPKVDVALWSATKKSLHLYLQMLGKVRVALSPPQPNWMFTPLLLSARGLTTGFVPYNGSAIEVSIDVFSSQIVVAQSSGVQRCIALLPARTVAQVYADFLAALDALGIHCLISPVPQEIADATPFHEDHRVREYDAAAVQRWFQATIAAAGVFDEWRSHFFGRSGIQVWWGALDVALLLFSGKRVSAPTDRGYLMKYDLDAELMNVGLYFGDEKTAPFFYGYIYPEPHEAASLPVAPSAASWSSSLREWVLPYEFVRNADSPAGELRAFLDALYGHCVDAAHWNAEDFRYAQPPLPARQDPSAL